jgi:hypothetical protein
MQKNIIKLLIAVMASSALLMACKKDDKTTPVPEKVKKLMGTWKITSITTPKKNEPDTDSSILKACMSDDVILFNNAGFDFQDGVSKCDSSIFHYAKGTWIYQLTSDSLQLNATAPGKYVSWKIVTLNDSLLLVKYTDSLNPANKVTKKITFKH